MEAEQQNEHGTEGMDLWARLVRTHFVFARRGPPGAASAVAWRRLRGAERAELDAWVGSVCGLPGGFCAPFVAPAVHEPGAAAHRVRLEAGGTAVTLSVYSRAGHTARDLGFASAAMTPLLVACVQLLNEAASVLAGAQPRREVWVAFVPGPERRELPEGGEGPSVAPRHLNGGLTVRSDGRILVYRTEDAPKVLIHELLHAYGLEGRLGLEDAHDRAVERLVRVRPRGPVPVLGLNECYVDTLACFLHAAWSGRERGEHGLRVALNRQARHGLVAAARLLRHMGRGTRPVPAPDEEGEAEERTHAFAYLVCKAAVWHGGLKAFLGRFASASPGSGAAFAAHVAACLSDPGFQARLASASAVDVASRSLRMTPRVQTRLGAL